jgi:programmed cell death 6-interacting protein
MFHFWQRANMEFTQTKVQNQSATSREEKLKDIASAYDSYIELKGNLEEGTKVRLDFKKQN